LNLCAFEAFGSRHTKCQLLILLALKLLLAFSEPL
jgi:hypothetical protein